ncbi:protoporphyrinogen oxidase [Corynebacterium macginleyi]|uniref:protoporphyrinogen oxidase n=1 Tax=Corynebacterium macginleyi TaxID=38290 RepID=UPI001909072B|nr:protoporphyrinogen oxidase [Corynebacterium macginleyi]MBK4144002.1 protoporphyrinogen oxidase [Corynebacterium macginleyi]MBK4148213.1 protoporphyrinogen oxidase [Corynebacterium macginleyi]MBK4152041.1 protoporphyrinogen oxidase [Corynebacterium macginleyi]MBK4162045.1 protoporphyrinogen oxidase [Corynebacterium macginleyi]MBK4163453.1 protoporphyrinogen oxidase [Corynebacterium macginleyi]
MRIAIIGAGLAGLTAAYELRQHDVEVFEAAGRIGGKLYSVPFNDGPTDMGAEAFLARRRDAVDFFHTLGLAGSLVDPSGLRSLVYSGELKALPQGGVMGIPSHSAPVAHLVSQDTARRIDNEQPFDWTVGGDVSVGELVRRQYGGDLVDRVVSALLGGVYSCTADDLGLRATIPTLADALDALATSGPVTLSAAVRSVEEARGDNPSAGGPVFQTFSGGYAELYETLAEKSHAKIFVDTFISEIVREGDKFRLAGAPGDSALFDRVLVATPAPTAARLLSKVTAEAATRLKGVKLAASAVVGLKFESDIDPSGTALPQNSGILVATDQDDVHAKAFTLSSRKWPHLAQRGGALVRASFGRFGDDAIVSAAEDTLVDYALDDLQHLTGFDGRATGVTEIFTQRWFGGLPRFDATHLETVAAVRDALSQSPGVDVTGAWAGGVGVPAVIADARAAAARIASS